MSYFKLTEHILFSLSLPKNYGDFICSDHFLASDVKFGKLIASSLPTFLHRKSVTEHDHGYKSCNLGIFGCY